MSQMLKPCTGCLDPVKALELEVKRREMRKKIDRARQKKLEMIIAARQASKKAL